MAEKKKIKSPLKKKNFISSLLQDSTIGGGVGVQDTEYETIPSANISLTKGNTTVGASLEKGFSKIDKQNINSQIGLNFIKETDSGHIGAEALKSGKNKYFGFTFSKKLKKKKTGGHMIGKGHDYIQDLL
jgi:hypothetical protein